MPEKLHPNPHNHEVDTRILATTHIWRSAFIMLAICVPLVFVMRWTLIPILVIGGAVAGTMLIWAGFNSRQPEHERELNELRTQVKDLRERLANVEVINTFEDRLAEKELDSTREQAPPKAMS